MSIQEHTNYTPKGPKVTDCPDVQALVRGINAAHEKGALFFLAMQLAPTLEGYFETNSQPTAIELEALIAQVAKTMTSR